MFSCVLAFKAAIFSDGLEGCPPLSTQPRKRESTGIWYHKPVNIVSFGFSIVIWMVEIDGRSK